MSQLVQHHTGENSQDEPQTLECGCQSVSMDKMGEQDPRNQKDERPMGVDADPGDFSGLSGPFHRAAPIRGQVFPSAPIVRYYGCVGW